jgi:hypothetical protein
MPLNTHINALATRVANYLRDSVLPRVLPSGGSTGQALVKTSGADFVVGWSAVGGAAGLLSAALTVSPVAFGYAEVVLPAAGVTAGMQVVASFAGGLNDENDPEEWADSALSVTAIPEADQLRFVFVSANASPFVGVFNVDYQVAA